MPIHRIGFASSISGDFYRGLNSRSEYSCLSVRIYNRVSALALDVSRNKWMMICIWVPYFDEIFLEN